MRISAAFAQQQPYSFYGLVTTVTRRKNGFIIFLSPPSLLRPDTAPPLRQQRSAQTLLHPPKLLVPQPWVQTCICNRPGEQVHLHARATFASDQSACALHRTEPINGLVKLLCHLFPTTLYLPNIPTTSLASNEKFACALCACLCLGDNKLRLFLNF